MSDLSQLHDQAMELSDKALLAKRAGDDTRAHALFLQALKLESQAADTLRTDTSAEPTRSILYRSAASLAMDVEDYSLAQRFLATALSGDPPPEIASELQDLLAETTFLHRLKSRHIGLSPGELHFSIAGNAVGHGITLSDIFIDRVKDIERILYRTAERLLGHPFRERGAPKLDVQRGYSLYLTAPRAGSFAVTLRLGRQMELPGMDLSSQVIDEVMDCFSLLTEENEDLLVQRIPQKSYYHNFVGLAKRVAPDGDRVTTVGLASQRKGTAVKVAISKRRKDILRPTKPVTPAEEPKLVHVTGRLLLADARKAIGKIQLVEESGVAHPVAVPEGMMDDIVKPLWDEVVKVTGVRRRKVVHLTDISPAED